MASDEEMDQWTKTIVASPTYPTNLSWLKISREIKENKKMIHLSLPLKQVASNASLHVYTFTSEHKMKIKYEFEY